MDIPEDMTNFGTNSNCCTNRNHEECEIISREADNIHLNINPVIGFKEQRNLTLLFAKEYVIPERPTIPITKTNLDLHLKHHCPFQYKTNLSPEESELLNHSITFMLKENLIRKSNSKFSSPVKVLIENNEAKISVNYMRLNHLIKADETFYSHSDDPISKLKNKEFFTSLDLERNFESVTISEGSRKYTAFATPLEKYEYVKMPGGLKNSLVKFQHFLYLALQELIREEKIILYSNNILVATDTLDEQCAILKRLFPLLVANKLKLQLDRCQFFYTEIEYLGYKISKNGLKVFRKNKEAISKLLDPKNIDELKSFLSITNYFSNLIEDYPTKVKPLSDLLDQNYCKFQTNEFDAFENLKKILTKYPVFRIFNPRSETELHCDASDTGIGVILLQKFEDGLSHPVSYFSKTFTKEEAELGSSQREMLGIYHGLDFYKQYLQGIPFKIVTDCQSLVTKKPEKNSSPFDMKWFEKVKSFYCSLEYRKRGQLEHVDALSRLLRKEDTIYEIFMNYEFRLCIAPERSLG